MFHISHNTICTVKSPDFILHAPLFILYFCTYTWIFIHLKLALTPYKVYIGAFLISLQVLDLC